MYDYKKMKEFVNLFKGLVDTLYNGDYSSVENVQATFIGSQAAQKQAEELAAMVITTSDSYENSQELELEYSNQERLNELYGKLKEIVDVFKDETDEAGVIQETNSWFSAEDPKDIPVNKWNYFKDDVRFLVSACFVAVDEYDLKKQAAPSAKKVTFAPPEKLESHDDGVSIKTNVENFKLDNSPEVINLDTTPPPVATRGRARV